MNHSLGEVWLCQVATAQQEDISEKILFILPSPTRNRIGRQIRSLKYKDGQTTKNHQAIKEYKLGNRGSKLNKDRKYGRNICKIF